FSDGPSAEAGAVLPLTGAAAGGAGGPTNRARAPRASERRFPMAPRKAVVAGGRRARGEKGGVGAGGARGGGGERRGGGGGRPGGEGQDRSRVLPRGGAGGRERG